MIGFDMRGKVTLVTGAGGGLGSGISEVFAKAGAKVYMADLFFEDAQKKAQKIIDDGFLAVPVKLDVTIKEDIDALIDKIVADEGKIDHLIAGAGVQYVSNYMDSTQEHFRRTLDINLIGMDNCCHAALRHMLPRKEGKIVNIASASSRLGTAKCAHYSASKFAVVGLTQSIALAVAADNINVNAICPGIVLTDIGKREIGGLAEFIADSIGKTVEDGQQVLLQGIPMRRFQTPEDMGNAILFLCSDLAKNITGQALNVCGAMRMN